MFNSVISNRARLIGITFLALVLSQVQVQAQPKNVILFIGDGMGFEQVRAGSVYANGRVGSLAFESFPYKAEMTTQGADGSVDSAESATAMATGQKVNSGVISVATPGDGMPLTTLLELAKVQGKSTGLVTTVYVTHATPAAFGAHESSRNNYTNILSDYLNDSKPNVLFGGATYITPTSAQTAGYTVLRTRSELLALETETYAPGFLFSGQFSSGYIPFEAATDLEAQNIPHLSEMTAAALNLLDNNDHGFFLMVEGGTIDQAGHSNLKEEMVGEVVEFSNAVQRAVDWAGQRDDTLIIVCADHETGGLITHAPNGSGILPDLQWTTTGHTGVRVPVYAWGACAEQVSGIIDNTDIFRIATAEPYVHLTGPADADVVGGTDVTFTCSAHSGVGLKEVTLYVGSGAPSLVLSGTSDIDDAQLFATDDSSASPVEGPDTNAGSATSINVDSLNPHAHAVMKFPNLIGTGIGQLPPGTVIQSAMLTLKCTNNGDTLNLYRLTEDWVESEVTWNSRAAQIPWTNAGAGGTGSYTGSAIVVSTPPVGILNVDITAFVQEWANNPAANFGFVVLDTNSNGVDFDSSESANSPVLTITCQPTWTPRETQVMNGETAAQLTFGPIALDSGAGYTWNCLVTNMSGKQEWAANDATFVLDASIPNVPQLVAPDDSAAYVPLTASLQVNVTDPEAESMDVAFYGRETGQADDFSIIVLPDTQYYTQDNTATIFDQQTQYIAAMAAARKTVFVTQTGDIVDIWNSTTQWNNASTSIGYLDAAAIPYGLLPGNHDMSADTPPDTSYYNAYFPYTLYEGLPWYGGHYSATNDNNYQLFTAGGRDYIILHVGYNPTDAVIAWADGILKENAHRIAMITTHSYIDGAGTLSAEGGTRICNGLVLPNENVRFVFCSHFSAIRTQVRTTPSGREVYEMLANYHYDGWLRMLWFDPQQSNIHVDTYSPSQGVYDSPASTTSTNRFKIDYDVDGFQYIGTQSSIASGQTAEIVWSGRQPDTSYEWYVEVTDAGGKTTRGPKWSFTTGSPSMEKATNPIPANGAANVPATTDLEWTAGTGNFTHDVYLGTDRTAVAAADSSSPEFKGNQSATTFDPGPLAYLTTWYWRIDEKSGDTVVAVGDVWSFQTETNPYKASAPSPVDLSTNVDLDVLLSWTPGRNAYTHDIYFGTDALALPLIAAQPETTCDPGVLTGATTYYWRIDEKDAAGNLLAASDLWTFTTEPEPAPGMATEPNPGNGGVDVAIDGVSLQLASSLNWTIGDRATSHRVYLGTTMQAVQEATPESIDVYKGEFSASSYTVPDQVEYNASYFWRIDEVGLGGVTTGEVWSFVTQVDTHAPVYPYDGVPQVFDLTAHQVRITWGTNEPTTGQIEEFDGNGYTLVGEDANLSTSHTVTLTGLTANSTYEYRIASTDDAPAPGPYTAYYGSLITVTTLPNTTPVATSDIYNATEDTTLVVPAAEGLLANDSDNDGDALSVAGIKTAPAGDLVWTADGAFTYTPPLNFWDTDTFEYWLSDGDPDPANWVAGYVEIEVDGVNDAPVAGDDDAGTVEEDGSLTIELASLMTNDTDVDEFDTLTLLSFTQPSHGNLVYYAETGMFTYTPEADYFGPDSFTYTIEDNGYPTHLTDVATVSITVASVNDAPVAHDQSVSTARDVPVDITLTADDLAGEGQVLTYAIITEPANGALSGTAPDLTYTPIPGYAGSDSFTFQARDGEAYSNLATVSISVVAVNRPPVADDESFSTNEGVPLIITDDVLLNGDSDPDGDSLTIVSFTQPAHGSLLDNGDGTVTYTPELYFFGSDSFEYTVQDNGDPALTDTATVAIEVGAVNDPPVAADDSFTTTQGMPLVIFDSELLANDTDPDIGDTLTVTEFTQPLGGTIVDNLDGSITYTPDPAVTGPDTFTYTVTDGELSDVAVVTVDVTALDYTAYVATEPAVTYGVVSGTIAATTAADDGLIQSIDEGPNGPAAYSLQVEYTLNTQVDPAAISEPVAVNLVHTWTGGSEDALVTELLVGDQWVNITADIADGQCLAFAADIIDAQGNIRIRFSDSLNKKKEARDTLAIDLLCALIVAGPDTTPPSPNPMTWQVAPHAMSATSIGMTAETATDASGVEYYFACREDATHDSGWQADSTYEDSGLITGNTYTYTVMARDTSPNHNETSWSIEASAVAEDVPPAAPTGLTAAPGDNLVNLDWNDNTEADLAGYNVYRSAISGGGYTRLNQTGLVASSAYSDNTAVNGTTYYYVVTAVDNAAGESYVSQEAAATPSPASAVYVAEIAMSLTSAGKNWKGDAAVSISPVASGAIVSGDWFCNGVYLSSASGTTDQEGRTTLSSVPVKASAGDLLTLEVTDVALAGYNYDPNQGQTSASITVQ